jgi:hypothetical protein
MKKTLLFVAAAAFCIISCEKKRCYDCETTVLRVSPTDSGIIERSVKAICDVTEDEIKDVEEKGSYLHRVGVTTTLTETKCKY